jgi:hypothetical protein
MSQSLQWVIIVVLFIGAIIYLVTQFQKSSKGETCAGAACECKSNIKTKKAISI